MQIINLTQQLSLPDNDVIAGWTAEYNGHFHYLTESDVPNYAAVGKPFGIRPDRMIRMHQTHTDKILLCTAANGGEGITREGRGESYDALITDTKGLMLCAVTADCVPVFLYDPVRQSVGIVHSGRKGSGELIAGKTVLRMVEAFGSDPADILCYIGPHICKCCYEVGTECADPFRPSFPEEELKRIFVPSGNGKYRMNLEAAVRFSLRAVGVKEEHIRSAHICTFENKSLPSYRRTGDTVRRILSFIALPGQE